MTVQNILPFIMLGRDCICSSFLDKRWPGKRRTVLLIRASRGTPPLAPEQDRAPTEGDFDRCRVSDPLRVGNLWAAMRVNDAVWPMMTVLVPDRSNRSTAISSAYADATDEELMAWSSGGDTRAFDEIVVRYGPFALRVARRLLLDRTLAQDIAQEAMVRVWTQSARFNARRARVTTWLYRIVVNLCIDQRRRLRPESFPEGFDAIDPAASVSEELEARERSQALLAALDELSVRQRAAITLVYDEGLSGAETARVLGLSAKAVERLLARARALLRERLALAHDVKAGD